MYLVILQQKLSIQYSHRRPLRYAHHLTPLVTTLPYILILNNGTIVPALPRTLKEWELSSLHAALVLSLHDDGLMTERFLARAFCSSCCVRTVYCVRPIASVHSSCQSQPSSHKPSELHWFAPILIAANIEHRLLAMSQDPFQILPPELVRIVLGLLSSKDLYRLGQVSHCWRFESDNAMLPRARLGLQRVLRSTTLCTQNISTWSSKMINEMLSQMPRISATDYFDNIRSFRVLYLATDLLAQCWSSGRPTSVQNINRNTGRRYRKAHYGEILSVVIDVPTKTLITGDIDGNLVWWDIASGKKSYGHHTNRSKATDLVERLRQVVWR